jgi:hypothetical protein
VENIQDVLEALARADRERGHAIIPGPMDREAVPPLYSTERTAIPEKQIMLHYFCGPADWWVVEADWRDNLAFGFVCLGNPQDAEWGYIDLVEIGLLVIGSPPIHFRVDRDLYWTPKPFSEVWPAGRF